jgi:probable AcnD-accessory protein PrpF
MMLAQKKIQAVYMRGGTSKGVFFHKDWLPADPALRDRILLRVIGSPDPYGQQIDGMGGATSSTSKVVLVSPSARTGCDVDYLFGQVAIDKAMIDWSGNCGNLTAAVGPFAIVQGLVAGVPHDGIAIVRIWQANIDAKIIAHVPMRDGAVAEEGDFELDGVTFPAAEIKIEFLDPSGEGDDGGAMFPSGSPTDVLDVPGVGPVELTMINAGNPAIFVDAATLGLAGNELQRDINSNHELLQKVETIRAHAAVRMGLAKTAEEASQLRPHTPKLAFVAKPTGYVASNGKHIDAATLDINARIFSMGKLHHAMTGTGAIAIAVAAVIPGTIVHRLMTDQAHGWVRFGHPSGSLAVGAEAEQRDGAWVVTKAVMSRSARRLMEGVVLVPSTVSSLPDA